ncbi:MAG: PilZ domain-containing protein [bacterium]
MKGMGGAFHHGILNLKLTTKETLYQAYMPFVEGGGLFVESKRSYSLGDEVFLLLELENEEKVPVTGKVVWSTPKGSGGRKSGIGIQLAEKHTDVVHKLETMLAGLIESDKPTLTM